MNNIKTISLEDINDKTIIDINYPYIEKNNPVILDINKDIEENIMIFKEVAQEEIKLMDEEKYLSYINTDYKVYKNTDELINIVIEFSQCTGFYYIEYISSYNYDFLLDRSISLDDIFKNEIYK